MSRCRLCLFHYYIVVAFIMLNALVSSAQTMRSTTQPALASTEPAATEPSDEVRQLVIDLGSDSYNARESAQRKLIGMTDTITPQLQGALKLDMSDEARQRLLSILSKLDENQRVAPSVITMHYKDAPMLAVLQDFARQSEADMGVNRKLIADYSKGKTVSIDLDHANFWQALKQIHAKTGLQPQLFNNAGRLILDSNVNNPFELFSDRMITVGSIAIIPQQCTEDRTIQYTRPGNINSTLSLIVVAVAEPKLKVLSGPTGNWMDQCLDNDNNSLVPLDPPPPMFYGAMRMWWWQLATNLREVTKGGGSKITTLRGTLSFRVQMKSEKLEFDDVMHASDASRSAGDTTVTLRTVTFTNNIYEIHLSFTGLRGADLQNAQSIAEGMQLYDDAGEIMQQSGIAPAFVTGHVELNVLFLKTNPNKAQPKPQTPSKLIWDAATQSKEITAPFELHDLELPRVQN